MSVKSRHSSPKKEKVRKDKRKKLEESEEDIESSEEELDLTKECHPIGYYMDDRPEMINQMFSVIKGNKLKAMLPPVLKDTDTENLKLLCLDQLLGMSEKRITCILEGEILDTSSESDVENSDAKSNGKDKSSSGSSSPRSADGSPYIEGVNKGSSVKHNRKRKADAVSDGTPTAPAAPEQGKTLLEILELEMRARAIRALLKQGGTDNTESEAKAVEASQNGVKEASDEIVDLTECEEDELPVKIKKERVDESESDIDKRVLNFEKKIQKSQAVEKDKSNQPEDERARRLQAELELRNRLFKKKIYRTRQQRMENEEEDEQAKRNQLQKEAGVQPDEINVEDVVVKQEPTDPEEIVVEDPEEGEVSTSEDEYPVEIKMEAVETEAAPEIELQQEPEPPTPVEENSSSLVTELVSGAQRISAMDNGAFVLNHDTEKPTDIPQTAETSVENDQEMATENNGDTTIESNQTPTAVNPEEEKSGEQKAPEKKNEKTSDLDSLSEGTSWRDRWLRKEDVQKLVKSSKICAKVKKKLISSDRTLRLKEGNSSPLIEAATSSTNLAPVEVIEGSIEEYERLLGKSIDRTKTSGSVAEVSSEEVPNSGENVQNPIDSDENTQSQKSEDVSLKDTNDESQESTTEN